MKHGSETWNTEVKHDQMKHDANETWNTGFETVGGGGGGKKKTLYKSLCFKSFGLYDFEISSEYLYLN